MILGWSPGIGDPTVGGWMAVAGYFVAALLCLRAARRDRGARTLWRLLAVALVLLGFNKQLDLQSLLTDIGRQMAMQNHWYERRRIVQRDFILAILIGAAVTVGIVLLLVRRKSGALKGAALGFILLCAFLVMRAASFHGMDHFIHTDVVGVRWNHVLELGGIAVIGLSAALAGRPGTRRRAR